MNNSNQLETELESWIPRAPSARLKQRLFPAAVAPLPAPAIPLWAKFAPAMCILLLTIIFCVTPPARTSYLAASAGSNAFACLSSNLLGFCATNTRSVRENTWQIPVSVSTFDWTSGVRWLSTTDSLPLWNTNVQKL